VENLTSKKGKSLKSENAKEYNSGEIQKFFCNQGILHGKSIAYIYETNGMAEWFNRTLVNMARVILESKLPK
jgi:transposase InsO family protein